MALKTKLFGHSSVYALGSFLEQGMGVILFPLYTRVLTQEDYGIIGYCRSVTGVVTIFLGLGLHGAASRLYFEYRDDPKALKEFWGTVFVALFVFSISVGMGLAFFGGPLFGPILGEIPFYPFVAIALVTASAAPFLGAYLRILQTRHQSFAFIILNSTRFLASMLLIIYLVVGRGMGALGPLTSYAVMSVLYLLISLFLIRKDLTICFHWKYFRQALGYSIPILPTATAGRVSVVADRIILNKYIGPDPLGVYHAGYQMGYPLSVIEIAINSAFSPIFRDAMKTEDEDKLRELKRIGLFLVFGYCVLGSSMAFFAREIVWIAAGPRYQEAFIVVPFIAFYFSLHGIYSLFVSPLQYYRHTLWFGFPIVTGGMILNVLLNLWWIPIPSLGIIGAAMAALSTQSSVTVVTALVGARYSKIHWQYGRYAAMAIVAVGVGVGINFLPLEVGWGVLGLKVLGLVALSSILSSIGWNDPLYIARRGRSEWRRLQERRRKMSAEFIEEDVENSELE
jgi:O-antigen/teichoic acid export membrane protein